MVLDIKSFNFLNSYIEKSAKFIFSYLVHHETLLQNATQIMKKCDIYFYYEMQRSLLQNMSLVFDSFITKMQQLIQNVKFTTECVSRRIELSDPLTDSESFLFKTKIAGSAPDNLSTRNIEIIVPSKYLSIFWRSLELPLFNCDINLTLSWPENCLSTGITTCLAEVELVANTTINLLTESEFTRTDANLCVPIGKLTKQDNTKLLQKLKSCLKGSVSLNKKGDITKKFTRTNNNEFSYLIHPNFQRVNGTFVLIFKNLSHRASFLIIIFNHQLSEHF